MAGRRLGRAVDLEASAASSSSPRQRGGRRPARAPALTAEERARFDAPPERSRARSLEWHRAGVNPDPILSGEVARLLRPEVRSASGPPGARRSGEHPGGGEPGILDRETDPPPESRHAPNSGRPVVEKGSAALYNERTPETASTPSWGFVGYLCFALAASHQTSGRGLHENPVSRGGGICVPRPF